MGSNSRSECPYCRSTVYHGPDGERHCARGCIDRRAVATHPDRPTLAQTEKLIADYRARWWKALQADAVREAIDLFTLVEQLDSYREAKYREFVT